jgi:hypothetical protein
MEIPSPNSCAPKFTLVHILAFLNFLQFLNFFPIVSATKFSVINFQNLEINFKIRILILFPFTGPLAIWPIPAEPAHRACAALSPFFFPAPTERAAVPCHPPPTFHAMEQTH